MFTVMGAGGFIGSRLAASLRAAGEDVAAPGRADALDAPPAEGWGDVIYCVGLTADFRTRPFDTMDAHVATLLRVLRAGRFDSFLYLSSTRVYGKSGTGRESDPVRVDPNDPSDLYNLSKLAGESLCLAVADARVRVVRLSNVFGDDLDSENFLTDVLWDAVMGRTIDLRASADSAKDYVAIDDVVDLLPRIARSGRARLYNVASGRSITNRALLDAVSAATGTGWRETPQAPSVIFPPIDIGRIRDEFAFEPTSLLDRIPDLVAMFRSHQRTSKVSGL